jgi:hypothetical protein
MTPDKLSLDIENSEKIKSKIENFKSLLQDIESLSDKKRQLWIEIYTNAVNDRNAAYAMFATLVQICSNKSPEHAIHGRSISSYLERMSKATDQLLKLADLIAQAKSTDEPAISQEDIYAQLKGQH